MGYNRSTAGGAIAALSCEPPTFSTVRDYIELTKPRITWLILMSTGIGFFFGAQNGWNWLAFLHTIIGTGLIASGTAALNQWYERVADARMNRTRQRPIPSGRVTPAKAFWFAVALSVLGFAELWVGRISSLPCSAPSPC